MAIYPSRVKLEITHNESQDDAGKPTFILSINASEPEGFPPYLDGTSPHCCFVYQRGELNKVNEAQLLRIATLDDLKAIPVETGYTSGLSLYRSNSFSQAYTTDANMLLEQESIFRSLFVLYQDIKTLYSELVDTKRMEKFLLPDGYHDQIDALIKQLLNYRGAKLQKEELYKAIVDVSLPAMNTQYSLLQRMYELTDQVAIVINEESTQITDKLTSGLTASNSLQSTFQQADDFLSTDNRRKTDTDSLAAEIYSLAVALPESDQSEAIKTKANAIRDLMLPRTDTFITLGNLTQIRQSMAPAMGLFRQIDAVKIIQMTNISNLKLIIDNKLNTIKQQIATKQTEADNLQLDIELSKRNIQTIEGRLKVLMPSIDLNNPDNKWSVQVNIQTGGNS